MLGEYFLPFLVHTSNLVGRVTWSNTTLLGRLESVFTWRHDGHIDVPRRQPCWCSKAVLYELTSFLKQTNSFVPVSLQGCWSREWKRSLCNDWELRQLLNYSDLNKRDSKSRLSKQTLHHDRGPGVWISWKYVISICSLRKQCSTVGIPLEQKPVYL